MKRILLYLFMGVGLLYTRALARILSHYKHDSPDDSTSRFDNQF